MYVEMINGPRAIEHVGESWSRLYANDPEANIFLSSQWQRSTLELAPNQYFLLAAKSHAESPDYLGVFPLRQRTKESADGATFREAVVAGGRVSDLNGFLCDPSNVSAVSTALASVLYRLDLAQVSLHNIPKQSQRCTILLDEFRRRNAAITSEAASILSNGTNNAVVPFVHLPNSWDLFLQKNLSANSRQKANRFLRKIDKGIDFSVRPAAQDEGASMIDLMLAFWRSRWAASKGSRLGVISTTLEKMLRKNFDAQILQLHVLYHREMPIAIHSILVDDKKKKQYFFLGSRKNAVEGMSPNFALHCWAIRAAINSQFVEYNFLRGDEAYKYSFGSIDSEIGDWRVCFQRPLKIGARGRTASSIDRTFYSVGGANSSRSTFDI